MQKAIMLGAVAAALLPVVALAQPVSGLYVAAGGGGNFATPATQSVYQPRYSFAGRSYPAYAYHYSVDLNPGAAGVASIGYGFGNGFRVEAEGDYRYNSVSHISQLYTQKYGGMANVLFDLDIGSPYAYPYLGAGAGYMENERNSFHTGEFAYQGIVGVALPIAPVVGLSATLEYRFLGLGGASLTIPQPIVGYTRVKYSDEYNNSLMAGLRYAFNTVPPPLPPSPAPVAAPAPAPSRTYLVFFDWDRADLTDRARAIIDEAARNAARVQYTRIQVDGYTDLSGTPAYNQRLSVRRAQAVGAQLVRDGIPASAITLQGYGETHPLVPTAQGVREPQNRRVEIIIR